MMKWKILLLLSLLVVTADVMFALCSLSYDCRASLAVVQKPARGDAEFRVKSAVAHLLGKKSLADMTSRLASKFSTDGERVQMRQCLDSVRIDVVKGPPMSVVVTTSAGSRHVAQTVGMFVADEVRRHFETEASGLQEKMTAWLEQEIQSREKKGEDVVALKAKAMQALQDVEANRIALSDLPHVEMEATGSAMIYRLWLKIGHNLFHDED